MSTGYIHVNLRSEKKQNMLKKRLEKVNDDIKTDPTNDNNYYKKGICLEKLSELLEDSSELLNNAKECYDKAIGLTQTSNQLYLIARSEIFTKLQLYNLAWKDIETIKKLGPYRYDAEDKYIQTTMAEIQKVILSKNVL